MTHKNTRGDCSPRVPVGMLRDAADEFQIGLGVGHGGFKPSVRGRHFPIRPPNLSLVCRFGGGQIGFKRGKETGRIGQVARGQVRLMCRLAGGCGRDHRGMLGVGIGVGDIVRDFGRVSGRFAIGVRPHHPAALADRPLADFVDCRDDWRLASGASAVGSCDHRSVPFADCRGVNTDKVVPTLLIVNTLFWALATLAGLASIGMRDRA